jgi:hypothetical protein
MVISGEKIAWRPPEISPTGGLPGQIFLDSCPKEWRFLLIIRRIILPTWQFQKNPFRPAYRLQTVTDKATPKNWRILDRGKFPWRNLIARSGKMSPARRYLFPKRNKRGGHMGQTWIEAERVSSLAEGYTYKSIRGTIFKNRRLRIGSEHNAKAHREPDLSAIRWSRWLGDLCYPKNFEIIS